MEQGAFLDSAFLILALLSMMPTSGAKQPSSKREPKSKNALSKKAACSIKNTQLNINHRWARSSDPKLAQTSKSFDGRHDSLRMVNLAAYLFNVLVLGWVFVVSIKFIAVATIKYGCCGTTYPHLLKVLYLPFRVVECCLMGSLTLHWFSQYTPLLYSTAHLHRQVECRGHFFIRMGLEGFECMDRGQISAWTLLEQRLFDLYFYLVYNNKYVLFMWIIHWRNTMALIFFGVSFIITALILLSLLLLFIINKRQNKGIIKKSISILLVIFICFASYILVGWIISFSQHFWSKIMWIIA